MCIMVLKIIIVASHKSNWMYFHIKQIMRMSLICRLCKAQPPKSCLSWTIINVKISSC
uniref:Uncharacterized protein n=1 Tax=Anguilla anguilla TaxID=7936 RepID=A0A0E9T917_ANGAN